MRLFLVALIATLALCSSEPDYDDEAHVASQLSCLDLNNDGIVHSDECPIALELDESHLDIDGLKQAWLNNPARAWTTDDLIKWAKRRQLQDMLATLDTHNIQGDDIPKLAANDDMLYARLGIQRRLDRHRLSAKAYDLLIFGPGGRSYMRFYTILAAVLAGLLLIALMVIKRLYRKVKAAKSYSSEANIESWLLDNGYEDYAALFQDIGPSALLDMNAEQLRGVGVLETDCYELESDIQSFKRVFLGSTSSKPRRRLGGSADNCSSGAPSEIASPPLTRASETALSRTITVEEDEDDLTNSVFQSMRSPVDQARKQSSIDIVHSPLSGSPSISRGSTFLLSPRSSIHVAKSDSGVPADSAPPSSESSAPTTQSEACEELVLKKGVYGRSRNGNVLVPLENARLSLMRKVGSGQYGDVWKSSWSGITEDGEEIPQRIVAAKILKVSGVAESDKHFHRELSNLSKLKHYNIIELMGASTLNDVILVTSYANAGSLYHFLHQESILHYNIGFVYRIAKEIASGMDYLYSQHILHRDLKSQNVLLQDDQLLEGEDAILSSSNACQLRALIGDFGLSKQSDHLTMMTGTPGTPGWMAPEVIRNEASGSPADVYSYSIVVWELLCRQAPWSGMEAAQILFAVAAFHKRPPIPDTCPDELRDLIERCWHVTPAERPTFNEICSFLDQFDVECSVDDDDDNSLATTQMTWQGGIKEEFTRIRQQHESTLEALEARSAEVEKLKAHIARLEQGQGYSQAKLDRTRQQAKTKMRRRFRKNKSMPEEDEY
eukprot:m.207958 g.207958  ORF g.207958 m.207958 type:complete len:780 (+) comp17127_c0_seq1:2973-5312(+)